MSVFDRSWYGRVLVERIEGFATEDQWLRAYEEIVQFERANALEGVIIVKFWLQISLEEQLKRFEDRQNDPLRRWKITEEDWRNRTKAAEYVIAAEEMFERTDHHLAPWDVISGENKRLARVLVLETSIQRIEQGMARWGMQVPAADELDQRGRTAELVLLEDLVGLAVDAIELVLREIAVLAVLPREPLGADRVTTVGHRVVARLLLRRRACGPSREAQSPSTGALRAASLRVQPSVLPPVRPHVYPATRSATRR